MFQVNIGAGGIARQRRHIERQLVEQLIEPIVRQYGGARCIGLGLNACDQAGNAGLLWQQQRSVEFENAINSCGAEFRAHTFCLARNR